jgi:hypothetical protein
MVVDKINTTQNRRGGKKGKDMDIHTEKTLWYHKGAGFTVEVAVWSNPTERERLPSELFDALPEYHWNVYVHIFPEHPLFNLVVKEDLYDYGIDLPLHCGSSYHRWDYDASGAVIAKHIGSDYMHYCDARFGKYKTKEEAWKVFQDADELIEFFEVRKAEEAPSMAQEARQENKE